MQQRFASLSNSAIVTVQALCLSPGQMLAAVPWWRCAALAACPLVFQSTRSPFVDRLEQQIRASLTRSIQQSDSSSSASTKSTEPPRCPITCRLAVCLHSLLVCCSTAAIISSLTQQFNSTVTLGLFNSLPVSMIVWTVLLIACSLQLHSAIQHLLLCSSMAQLAHLHQLAAASTLKLHMTIRRALLTVQEVEQVARGFTLAIQKQSTNATQAEIGFNVTSSDRIDAKTAPENRHSAQLRITIESTLNSLCDSAQRSDLQLIRIAAQSSIQHQFRIDHAKKSFDSLSRTKQHEWLDVIVDCLLHPLESGLMVFAPFSSRSSIESTQRVTKGSAQSMPSLHQLKSLRSRCIGMMRQQELHCEDSIRAFCNAKSPGATRLSQLSSLLRVLHKAVEECLVADRRLTLELDAPLHMPDNGQATDQSANTDSQSQAKPAPDGATLALLHLHAQLRSAQARIRLTLQRSQATGDSSSQRSDDDSQTVEVRPQMTDLDYLRQCATALNQTAQHLTDLCKPQPPDSAPRNQPNELQSATEAAEASESEEDQTADLSELGQAMRAADERRKAAAGKCAVFSGDGQQALPHDDEDDERCKDEYFDPHTEPTDSVSGHSFVTSLGLISELKNVLQHRQSLQPSYDHSIDSKVS